MIFVSEKATYTSINSPKIMLFLAINSISNKLSIKFLKQFFFSNTKV